MGHSGKIIRSSAPIKRIALDWVEKKARISYRDEKNILPRNHLTPLAQKLPEPASPRKSRKRHIKIVKKTPPAASSLSQAYRIDLDLFQKSQSLFSRIKDGSDHLILHHGALDTKTRQVKVEISALERAYLSDFFEQQRLQHTCQSLEKLILRLQDSEEKKKYQSLQRAHQQNLEIVSKRLAQNYFTITENRRKFLYLFKNIESHLEERNVGGKRQWLPIVTSEPCALPQCEKRRG